MRRSDMVGLAACAASLTLMGFLSGPDPDRMEVPTGNTSGFTYTEDPALVECPHEDAGRFCWWDGGSNGAGVTFTRDGAGLLHRCDTALFLCILETRMGAAS